MARVSAEPLPSRPIVPHCPARCSACNAQLEFPDPQPPLAPGFSLRVRCFACHAVFTPTLLPSSSSTSAAASSTTTTASASNTSKHSPPLPPPPPPRKARLIGTQDRPLETEYYDLLGVPPSASADDIKKSYRRLAIKHHPDKNLSDPSAAERFKRISIAYQTLSDPALRAKYNEFGAKAGTPEGGYVDPEEVFGAMFGGERFVPIIGNISLAKEMKAAMQEGEEGEEEAGEGGRASDLGPDVKAAESSGGVVTHAGGERKRDAKVLSPEEKAAKEEKARKKAAEKAAAREARIATLVSNLDRKLSIFTESAMGPSDPAVTSSWRQICAIEASELVRESYGYELLQTTGFVYLSKAKHHLASHQTLFGVGGWFHNVQGKYHVFSETVSTLRSAMELKSVFDQLQAAEKAGGLTDEERKKLEEQAAEKGLQALFKGTKLEVEGVLREVCDRVLAIDEGTGGREKAVLRAVALQILGEAYMAVKRDPNAPGLHGFGQQARAKPHAEGVVGEDSEYVKVETNASRDRARSTAGRAG